MRYRTQTLLTLFEWSQQIGLHPYDVAQIGSAVPYRENMYPPNDKCESVFFQEAWQTFDQLCREEIGFAIAQAEDLFNRYVGYWPAPKYIVDEQHPYPLNYNVRANSKLSGWSGGFPLPFGYSGASGVRPMRTAHDHFRAIQLHNGHIRNVGTEELTQINTFATVLSSVAGSGINDTFTVTATNCPSGTTASEIAAFFVSGDRAGLSLEECEIRPLTVSMSSTTATITGSITLLVKPTLQQALAPSKLSATDLTIYASQVVVYRRRTDTSDTGAIIWENIYPCDVQPCYSIVQTSCFQAVNLDLGIVAPVPATFNESVGSFYSSYPVVGFREPDRVSVNYIAGYPRQANGRMDNLHARIIALLATSLLPNKTSGCMRADQRFLYYKMPMNDGQDATFVTPEMLNNPWGIGRGAIEGWNLAQPLIQYSSPRLG